MRDRLLILPPKHRIAIVPDDDRYTRVPRIEIPANPDEPPTFVVPPGGGVVPPVAVTPGELVDVSAIMPREPGNNPSPLTHRKDSITIHWLGGNFSRAATDSESQAYLVQVAYQHIRKDWGNGNGGNGIMYHEAIAPTGTVFVMRDYTDVVWHAANERGNLGSRAILVMCGPDTPPTTLQLQTVRRRFADFQVPIFRHMDWSATECPGPTLSSLVQELRSL